MPLTQTRWPFFAALVIGGLAIARLLVRRPRQPARRGRARQRRPLRRRRARARPSASTRSSPAPTRPTPISRRSSSAGSCASARTARRSPTSPSAGRSPATDRATSSTCAAASPGRTAKPFDAEDVVFTFRAIADPGFKGDPALAQLMQGVVVTARDPLTVEFKLEQTYAPFLAYLTVGILPRHLLDGLDPNQLFNAPFNAQPDRHRTVRVRARARTTASNSSRNPTYYLGPPLISTFEFRVFADTAVARGGAPRRTTIDGALLGAGRRRRPGRAGREDDRDSRARSSPRHRTSSSTSTRGRRCSKTATCARALAAGDQRRQR